MDILTTFKRTFFTYSHKKRKIFMNLLYPKDIYKIALLLFYRYMLDPLTLPQP